MDSDNHSKYWFLGLFGLIVFSCWQLNQSWKNSEILAARPLALEVSYEMPRPQAYSKALDLSQRSISRNVQQPQATNRVVNTTAIATAPNKGLPAAQNVAKKTDDKKKKEADKKKQAEAAKKKKFNVMIYSKRSAADKKFERVADAEPYLQSAVYKPAAQATPVRPEAQLAKPKITAAQWRNILFTDPSTKNVADFVSAYRRGELNANEFYLIVREMITNQDQEYQSAAIVVLNADNSSQGFEILVTLQAQVTEQTRAAMVSLVESYAQSGKFSALSRSLLSTIPEVAGEATRLLDIALENAITEENPRELRGLASGATPQAFQIFVPALQRLIASPESPLSGAAQSLLEQIQALLQNVG
jgi:hypothetical protein